MTVVALPLENKVREFHGKLWLGLNLVQRGGQCILGPSYEIKSTLDITRPDVYVTKDPSDNNIDFLRYLRSSGIRVYGLDPEAGINDTPENYMKNKKEFLDYLDGYFAWGPDHAEALYQYYGESEDIFVTGNPRFDLLTPDLRHVYDEESHRHRQNFGDYILVNTNFGIGNPFDRELQLLNMRKVKDEMDLTQYENFKTRLFYLFLEAALYLSSADENYNIVIRPHPGEDHSAYEEAFGVYEDISVEHHGDARSWIAGAEAVVHHSCTTGIESVLLDTPAISYQPIQSDIEKFSLSQEVSEEVSEREDLNESVQRNTIRSDSFRASDRQKRPLRGYFPNGDQLAAEEMCRIITEMDSSGGDSISIPNPEVTKRVERWIKASHLAESATELYDFYKSFGNGPNQRIQREKARQKFPGLTEREIHEFSRRLSTFFDAVDLSVDRVPRTKNSYLIARSV